jgi:hypothetical protein
MPLLKEIHLYETDIIELPDSVKTNSKLSIKYSCKNS